MDLQKELLIQISQELLFSNTLELAIIDLPDAQLAIEIQSRFQNEIKAYYRESDFREKALALSSEQEIVDLLANVATGDNKGPVGYLPKLHKANSSAEMECTLASAFLKLAFEEKGIQNVRTCLLIGHQVTIKYLDDGSIQMFDAANTHTIGGARHGFSHLFTPSEVTNKENVQDRPDEKHAFTFEIETAKTPQELNSGILEQHDQVYKKKFYAHDPNILISLSVILDNLNDEQIKKTHPFLKQMNYKEMVKKFNLFDKDKYLSLQE